jgi:6-phosphogluconolactonase (cycloisomerase 2 family)
MSFIRRAVALGLTAAATTHAAHADDFLAPHAVFVMTNDADENSVIAYERSREGTLSNPHRFSTGGRGSGGTIDPLASQGSLTLSAGGDWLFAANAGSGTVAVFRVLGSRLLFTDRTPSGGSEPNAIAQHGKLVYVLNTAGSSSVVGFRLDDGRLKRIDDSQRFLTGNTVNSSSIAFTPDGRFLVVTERATNNIDVFRVQGDGRLAPIVVNAAAAPGTFSAVFAPNGALIVSETGAGGPLGSTISSYSLASNGKLLPVSTGVPTLGDANCWNVVTPDGRFVYASNAASSSISGFRIGAHGELAPIGSTVVGVNPEGSTNIDVTISGDGRFLYSLNAGAGSVGAFAIQRDGSLVSLGTRGGLPAGAGLNGIAAN